MEGSQGRGRRRHRYGAGCKFRHRRPWLSEARGSNVLGSSWVKNTKRAFTTPIDWRNWLSSFSSVPPSARLTLTLYLSTVALKLHHTFHYLLLKNFPPMASDTDHGGRTHLTRPHTPLPYAPWAAPLPPQRHLSRRLTDFPTTYDCIGRILIQCPSDMLVARPRLSPKLRISTSSNPEYRSPTAVWDWSKDSTAKTLSSERMIQGTLLRVSVSSEFRYFVPVGPRLPSSPVWVF